MPVLLVCLGDEEREGMDEGGCKKTEGGRGFGGGGGVKKGAGFPIQSVSLVLHGIDSWRVHAGDNGSRRCMTRFDSRSHALRRWGNAQSPQYGDIHFYNYSADSFDVATYPHARFVSEFGFQSLPSWSRFQTVTEPQDWHWNSTMSQFRQVYKH